MKTLYIIVIAVVCSVGATLSVLVGLELFAVYQIEKAIEKIEEEQRKELEAQLEKEAEIRRLNEIKRAEKEARLAEYEIMSLNDYRDEYWDCMMVSKEGYCREILNDMVNVFCEKQIPMNYESRVYTLNLCINKTNSEIMQNKTVTYELFSYKEHNKELYYEVVDNCRFHRGLSPYLEDPGTTNCVCIYGIIDYLEWYELCS